jgi:hypothetical protein
MHGGRTQALQGMPTLNGGSINRTRGVNVFTAVKSAPNHVSSARHYFPCMTHLGGPLLLRACNPTWTCKLYCILRLQHGHRLQPSLGSPRSPIKYILTFNEPLERDYQKATLSDQRELVSRPHQNCLQVQHNIYHRHVLAPSLIPA